MASHKSPTKLVHIHRQAISRNTAAGCNIEPVVIARYKSGKRLFKSNCVVIVNEAGEELARIVADVSNPLDCGARAWIETKYKLVDGDEYNNLVNKAKTDAESVTS